MAPVLAKSGEGDRTKARVRPHQPRHQHPIPGWCNKSRTVGAILLPVALAEILATVDRQLAIHISLRKTVPIASPTGKVA